MTYVAVALITLLGCTAQTSCGIGYAMVVMALMPLLIPFKTVAVLQILTVFPLVVYMAVRLRRHIRFSLILWPLAASLITSPLGVKALTLSSDSLLRRALGLLLVLLTVRFLWSLKRQKPVRATLVSGLASGALSGFCAGMLNIGGPPLAAYMLAASRSKEEYNASIQLYFAFSSVYIFLMHVIAGNVNSEVLSLCLPAFLGVAAGAWLGMKLFARLPLERIRQGVYGLMGLIGLYLLIRG